MIDVRIRVLVVDDEENDRRLLRAALSAYGFAVREARDGDEAVREIARERPDVLLLDLLMPNRNGLEVIADLERSPLPTVVMTGHLGEYASRLPPWVVAVEKSPSCAWLPERMLETLRRVSPPSGDVESRIRRACAVIDDATRVCTDGR